MRRGQSTIVSPLLFQTSRHHRVFPILLVLQPPVSHQPRDTEIPYGNTTSKTGFAFEVMVTKNQTLH